MDCKEFRERLDSYVDGELAAEAAEAARAHSAGCAPCSKAEAQLRRLRGSLKRAVKRHQPPPGLEREVLRSLRSRRGDAPALAGMPLDEGRRDGTPVWRAKVSVPLPFFALLVLSLVALVGWSLFARGAAREEVSSKRAVPVASPASQVEAPGALDFSRYYNGERASIRVVRRASLEGPGR